mmetsp:Transcript_2884/g.10988  ORF Transcript_2884/g.10988 Transcript_2884/m.10988 type:complete len:574 (-) Transcript_2884:1695-3416(-)
MTSPLHQSTSSKHLSSPRTPKSPSTPFSSNKAPLSYSPNDEFATNGAATAAGRTTPSESSSSVKQFSSANVAATSTNPAPIAIKPTTPYHKSHRFLSKTSGDKITVPYKLLASLMQRIDQLEVQVGILERRVAKGSGRQAHQQQSLEQLYLEQQQRHLTTHPAPDSTDSHQYESLRTQVSEMYAKMMRMDAEMGRIQKDAKERATKDAVMSQEEKKGVATTASQQQDIFASLGLTRRAQEFMNAMEISSLIEHLQDAWTKDLEKMRIDLRKEFTHREVVSGKKGKHMHAPAGPGASLNPSSNDVVLPREKYHHNLTNSSVASDSNVSSGDKLREEMEKWKNMTATLQGELKKVQRELGQFNRSSQRDSLHSPQEGTDSIPTREERHTPREEQHSRMTHQRYQHSQHLDTDEAIYEDNEQYLHRSDEPRSHHGHSDSLSLRQPHGHATQMHRDTQQQLAPTENTLPSRRPTRDHGTALRARSPQQRRAPPSQHPSPSFRAHSMPVQSFHDYAIDNDMGIAERSHQQPNARNTFAANAPRLNTSFGSPLFAREELLSPKSPASGRRRTNRRDSRR